MSNKKNSGILRIRFIIIFSVFIVVLQAQPDYRFRHLTAKDGLPNVYIQCIYQDSYGYMWFGSEDGLIKYNGFTFEYFTEESNDTNSMSGNSVRTITEDKNGNLWVGTANGLNYFNREKKVFTAYLADSDDPESIQSDAIYSIALDSLDNLWVASNRSGLSYLNTTTKKFKFYRHQKNNLNSLSSDHVISIYLDKQNRLWIGSQSGDIDLLLPGSNEFIHIQLNDILTGQTSANQIRSFIQDNQGNIWIATSGSGLYKLEYTSENEYNYKQFIHDQSNSNSLSINYVSSLTIDQFGNIIAGTENGGINYLDLTTNKIYGYTANPLNESSLSYH